MLTTLAPPLCSSMVNAVTVSQLIFPLVLSRSKHLHQTQIQNNLQRSMAHTVMGFSSLVVQLDTVDFCFCRPVVQLDDVVDSSWFGMMSSATICTTGGCNRSKRCVNWLLLGRMLKPHAVSRIAHKTASMRR